VLKPRALRGAVVTGSVLRNEPGRLPRKTGRFFGAGRHRRVTPDPLGSVRKDSTVVGGTRGQVLVGNLKRVGKPARVLLTHAFVKALECRACDLPESARLKHRREGAGKPVPRSVGKGSGEANEPHESIGPPGLRTRTGYGSLQ